MKKGQIVEGMIERVDFPNKGVITTEEGKQVIVKNGVQGQKVSASINKIRKVGQDKEDIYTCYVVDEARHLQGVVSAKALLLSSTGYAPHHTAPRPIDVTESKIFSIAAEQS